MNKLLIILFLFSANFTKAQTIKTGEYDFGLKLAFDKASKKLTGYFENYTGFDWETKKPKFSCIFYIEATVTGKQTKISTYYPDDNTGDMIVGVLNLVSNSKVSIQLPEEHGGCWNVEHFADKEPATFDLVQEKNWKRISYITVDKTFFFKEKAANTRSKAYLVKGDFICIDKIEGEWVHCTYFGDKTTTGWIKSKDIY